MIDVVNRLTRVELSDFEITYSVFLANCVLKLTAGLIAVFFLVLSIRELHLLVCLHYHSIILHTFLHCIVYNSSIITKLLLLSEFIRQRVQ